MGEVTQELEVRLDRALGSPGDDIIRVRRGVLLSAWCNPTRGLWTRFDVASGVDICRIKLIEHHASFADGTEEDRMVVNTVLFRTSPQSSTVMAKGAIGGRWPPTLEEAKAWCDERAIEECKKLIEELKRE